MTPDELLALGTFIVVAPAAIWVAGFLWGWLSA